MGREDLELGAIQLPEGIVPLAKCESTTDIIKLVIWATSVDHHMPEESQLSVRVGEALVRLSVKYGEKILQLAA